MTTTLSGLVFFCFKSKSINAHLKHPYLEHRAFNQYPFAIQAAITLDYFLRLMFPGARFWLLGHANRLLAHVQPKQVPLSIKWPIIGLWGGCWLGLFSMITLWALLLIRA